MPLISLAQGATPELVYLALEAASSLTMDLKRTQSTYSFALVVVDTEADSDEEPAFAAIAMSPTWDLAIGLEAAAKEVHRTAGGITMKNENRQIVAMLKRVLMANADNHKSVTEEAWDLVTKCEAF
jgi:hypothetical protein